MVEADKIFNFWGIISNDIIGDVWLTIFIFAIGIIIITIRFKMQIELQIQAPIQPKVKYYDHNGNLGSKFHK